MRNYNSDDYEAPLTDKDYEGVIYEPSNRSQPPKNTVKKPQPKKKPSSYPQKKKKAPKSNYKAFMLITIVSGVLICIVAAALVYNSFSDSPAVPVIPNDKLDTLDTKNIDASIENSKSDIPILGIISDLDYVQKQIVLTSLEENKTYALKLSGSALLKDKYDQVMTLAEFHKGDIVDFVFDSDRKLLSLAKSGEEWEYSSVKDASINSELLTVSFSDKTFTYNENIAVSYKNEPYDISKIDSIDTLSIKGYRNTVYAIKIEKNHGIIQINNKDAIKDGIIEVDTDVYKKLAETGSIKVSEGTHKIAVTGSNCEPFTKEIIVNSEETYNLDLSEVQVKSGILLIKTNVSDYLLSINDTPEFSREPLVLEYGAYTIKIEKEGYSSQETQIIIDKAQSSLEIELKKEVMLGKVTVSSSPDMAEVYIDNAKVGYTPVTAQVVVGKHNITVKKEGYNDFPLTGIELTEKENVYNITLQPIIAPVVTQDTLQTDTTLFP